MAVGHPLRLAVGDTLIETTSDGARQMHVVVRRLASSYRLKSNKKREPDEWTDDRLWQLYCDGRLEHFSADITKLDAKIVRLLEAGFESWPENLQFRARCKEKYCRYVDRLSQRGVPIMKAYERAARTVYRRNHAAWNNIAKLFAGQRSAKERKRRIRKGVSIIGQQIAFEKLADIEVKQPSLHAVRLWYQRWVSAGRVIDVLVDRYHDRGDFRPKLENRQDEQVSDDRPLCIYGAMEWAARYQYLATPRKSVAAAFRKLEEKCESEGIDCVSATTFYSFIRRRFTDFEEFKARYGWKAAYYKFKIFKRREAPSVLLEEVEVDHTLLDVFVRDALGRVGRPWLTLLICRATRCIVGLHIGFDVPSYATLQRALMHAICPKDLTGLGLEHDWPCSGIPQAIITDRGAEFLSESFKSAGQRLGFAIINLQGRCPHLKGAIERFFGTLNVRVLSYMDGSTKARTPQFYDPKAKARFSLAELTLRIVRWIVDEYHQERHIAIGCAPAELWAKLEATQRIPPVPNFKLMATLLGERVPRKVSNIGIQWAGHTYQSQELEELRKRRGAIQKDWEIRCDPYDRGEVLVLDDTVRVSRWVTVPAVHQATARGLTSYQARTHLRVARQLLPKGNYLTDAVMQEAKDIADQQARKGNGRRELRYFANGALPTKVIGDFNFLAILGGDEAPIPAGKPENPTFQTPTEVTVASTSHANELLQKIMACGEGAF